VNPRTSLWTKVVGGRVYPLPYECSPLWFPETHFSNPLVMFTIFCLYFGAIGLIVTEMGISIKAYLASGSIVGLAIGFGSQNFVQDLVSGLTVIFSGPFDVGKMVEVSGQTGIVKRMGLRFTALENSMGAEVFIPNRKAEYVLNYPRGYVPCLADIPLPPDPALSVRMESLVASQLRP